MLRVGLCSKTPRGRTGRARSVKRGGAHLQYIYNRFQKVSGRLVENPRTSSLHKILRTSDGRTDGRTPDGRTDGHHLELRTFNYTKSRFDTHRYHFRWKQKMHARTGQNLYGPLPIVRRAIRNPSKHFVGVFRLEIICNNKSKTICATVLSTKIYLMSFT